MRRFTRWKAVAFTAAATAALTADQGTKLLILDLLRHQPPGAAPALIPGHLYLQAAPNPLGSLGFLGFLSPATRGVFFAGATVAFAAFVIILALRLRPSRRAQIWPLALLLGSVLSNGVDRLVRGHVLDYVLLVTSPDGFRVWFNLADVGIAGALIWLVGQHLRGSPPTVTDP